MFEGAVGGGGDGGNYSKKANLFAIQGGGSDRK